MNDNLSQETSTEAVAVFQDATSLQDAIDEILSSGFDRAEISLLASEKAVEEKLGHAYKKAAALEDDPSVPRIAYISTEAIGDAKGALFGAPMYVAAVTAAGAMVASGGTLAGAIAAAAMAGGAGALVGSVLARLVGDHHAAYLEEQIERGGLLLWVRTRDKERERRANEILFKHSGQDVHIHALRVAGAG